MVVGKIVNTTHVSDAHLSLTDSKSFELLEFLNNIADEQSLELRDITTLVKHTLPLYPSIPVGFREKLKRLVSKSLPLLNHIIGFVASLKGSPETEIYKTFLIDVASEEINCLFNYLGAVRNAVELRLVQSVFMGSKLYNCLATSLSVTDYMAILKNQVQFALLRGCSQKLKSLGELLSAFLSFHPAYACDVLFGEIVLQSSLSLECFTQTLKATSRLAQSRLYRGLTRFLSKVSNESNSTSIYNVLEKTGFAGSNYRELIELKAPILRRVIITLECHGTRIACYEGLIDAFGKHEPAHDADVCQLLVMILQSFSQETKELLSHQERFLNAVTARLSSQDTLIRERTMFIGKLLTNGKLSFDSPFQIHTPSFNKPESEAINLESLKPSGELSSNKKDHQLERKINSLKLSEGTASNHSIFFLKDLLNEFNKTSKSRYGLTELLEITVSLVRQKKDFKTEVDFYADSLISTLSTLSNSFEEQNFEEWKTNAIVSILVTAPHKVFTLIKVLFEADLSLQQRMSILSSLALAARELRGLNDQMIVKLEDCSWKPPKNGSTAQLSNKTQKLVKDTVLQEGTVTWKSRKLSKDLEKRTNENRFQAVAAKFFFPLAHGWLNGIDLGPYDKMFKQHYLTTLRLILSAADPHSELNQMCEMMLLVMKSAEEQDIIIQT
ncbi:LAMI_0H05534g1_1 [Lachancea mirantina]|uniref:LAMI_0H05534g1_1 n=1 Tax=Lachancea mirantina TaxID=1230905 RepID=A0A1G4KEX5_9SACH|nr:LAMI_0H05534g1_1 [Lachancea mirantina]